MFNIEVPHKSSWMVDSCIWLIHICHFYVFYINKHFGVMTKSKMTLEKLQISLRLDGKCGGIRVPCLRNRYVFWLVM